MNSIQNDDDDDDIDSESQDEDILDQKKNLKTKNDYNDKNLKKPITSELNVNYLAENSKSI